MIRIAGPSYQLATRKADVQRAINLYLKGIESGSGKANFILEDIPGLTEFADLDAPCRGAFTTANGISYWVAGNKAYRLHSGGTSVEIGTLLTDSGPVEMDANTVQVGLVDGPYGYVITQADDTFTQITNDGFYGSKTIAVIDGYALFIRPDSGQFYISAKDDMLSEDPLDFATAEGAPDNAVAVIADHRQARIFNSQTTEGWFDSGDPDFPFIRDNSSYEETGTTAPYSVRVVANSLCYIGNSTQGNGIVYMAVGNAVQRISTHAVEEVLQRSTNLDDARAFTYQDGGHLFYCINAPGLESTWCYDISTQAWHERAELLNGDYIPWRPLFHTFAYGYHLFGTESGKIYRLDRSSHKCGDDELVRDRISPHTAASELQRVFFGAFELDATCGDAASGLIPLVQMRYSNDGGETWGDWMQRELGRIGEYSKRVRWLSCGSAYDRVWQIRCTDDAAFSIIGAACPAKAANG